MFSKQATADKAEYAAWKLAQTMWAHSYANYKGTKGRSSLGHPISNTRRN
jgi:hypothetical protein